MRRLLNGLPRSRDKHTVALVCACGVVACGAAFIITKSILTSPSVRARTTKETCALTSTALITQAAFPRFTRIVDQHQAAPPIPGGERDVVQRVSAGYLDGRVIGLLANEALTGPDRAQEDAYARSLGYTPGAVPLVPLSGAIVHDFPGALEIYESIYAYQTEAEAKALAELIDQSIQIGGSRTTIDGVPAGDAFFLPAPTSGPNPPYENTYQIVEVVASSVVRVSIQGGDALQASDAARVAEDAISQLNRACPAEASLRPT